MEFGRGLGFLPPASRGLEGGNFQGLTGMCLSTTAVCVCVHVCVGVCVCVCVCCWLAGCRSVFSRHPMLHREVCRKL